MNKFRKYIEDFVSRDRVEKFGEKKSIDLIKLANKIAERIEREAEMNEVEKRIRLINYEQDSDNNERSKKQKARDKLYVKNDVYEKIQDVQKMTSPSHHEDYILKGGLSVPRKIQSKMFKKCDGWFDQSNSSIESKIVLRTMKEEEYLRLNCASAQNIALKIYLED
jgi:hypothetical protein